MKIYKRISTLIKSKTFKSVSVLLTGSLLAQLIIFISLPVMTRLYSTFNVGIYSLILSAVAIFSPVINGKYELSIMQEEDENKIYTLYRLCIKVGKILSLIVAIGYLFYFAFNKAFQSYTIIFSIAIFIQLLFYTLYNPLIAYNNRVEKYSNISNSMIIRNIVQSAVFILLGLLSYNYLGLLFSLILGQIAATLFLIKTSKKIKLGMEEFEKSDIDFYLKKYKKMPMFTAPATLANTLSYSSINIFIGFFFGLEILGLYSISYKVLGLPLVLISGNIARVYFQKATTENERLGNFYNITIKTIVFLSAFSFLMFLVMFFLIPVLMPFLFGNDWSTAGKYVQIFAPMFSIRFITSSISYGLVIAGKQRIDFILQMLFIVFLFIGALLTSFLELNIETFLIFLSATYSLVYLIYLGSIVMYSKKMAI